MGLYLCVFDGDEEVDGVEVGSYDDFGKFRDAVRALLEGGRAGSRFPMLMLHSDSDGCWSQKDAVALRDELRTISAEFRTLPPIKLSSGWQDAVAKRVGLSPENLYQCFFDVDGEPLIDRVIGLCDIAIDKDRSIIFQ